MNKISLSTFLLLSLLNFANLFLVVPPTSPTRHQFIGGIGIPLKLEDEAITMGLVMKAQYFLVSCWIEVEVPKEKVFILKQPETANQMKFNFFPDIWSPYEKDFLWDIKQQKFPNGRRRRAIDPLTGEKYERIKGEVNQVGDVPLRNETEPFWGLENEDFEDVRTFLVVFKIR
jgi:hypothetical protein